MILGIKQNKSYTVGSWITIGHTIIAELMADAGFDWLCIDIEHSVIDYREVQELISVIQSKDVIAYVRVGENNNRIIKRVLDAGADGVIVPMVCTKTDAEKVVNAVRYPPYGKRGVGLSRAQGYGFGFNEYLDKQKDLDIIVQIEHIDAIHNLKEILSVKGVSGSIIGPYDLSSSLGKIGNYEDFDVKNALSNYEKISLEMNIPMGYHITDQNIGKFIEMHKRGYTILALSFDAMYLGTILRKSLKQIKSGMI
ncbi:MAG: 2,4-dihydroxyhept-2-ene-1,7-dioic acid aldolase [Candidatus Marinimicrobia bacterium]|nr:2,4-dihydroxyhept-2-ene-1,7-dioic acid aldolase [Candidatus Neomarinimicrobiota bacterium]|tara:strand:+ start:68516 stop:69274 length:759 start_codon:yes stop_codon:yes gene_type:complete